jgi:uncharacterized protein (DUF58 family)
VVRELLYHPPRGQGTNLGEALTTLHRVQKRKSVVFLLSDFLDEGFQRSLSMVGRRHDLIAMQLYDPRERELPPVGLMQLRDPETGARRLIDTSDRRVRQAYEEAARARQATLERDMRRAGCDIVSFDVTQPVVDPLQRFFLRRGKRR